MNFFQNQYLQKNSCQVKTMGEIHYFDFLLLSGDERKMIYASVFVLHSQGETRVILLTGRCKGLKLFSLNYKPRAYCPLLWSNEQLA